MFNYFKKMSLSNKLNLVFILTNICIFIASFVILFSNIKIVYTTNENFFYHSAFEKGKLIMSYPVNALPFLSFIFNLFTILASFIVSTFGTILIIKKLSNSTWFFLTTSLILIGFMLFMLYYSKSFHDFFNYEYFLHIH